jgi:membrane protease YdiL (CAAX protease family)
MALLWGVATLVVVALIGGIFQNVFLLLGVDVVPDAHPAGLRGNPAKLLLALIAVVAVAFGEELVFRGFLLDRIRRLLPAGRGGWQLVVFLGAVLYGAAHLPLGGQAVIVSGTAGLAYGAMYFGSGRSLWVVVAAHGILESLTVLGSATPSPEAG